LTEFEKHMRVIGHNRRGKDGAVVFGVPGSESGQHRGGVSGHFQPRASIPGDQSHEVARAEDG
jgi:hypothetical protein